MQLKMQMILLMASVAAAMASFPHTKPYSADLGLRFLEYSFAAYQNQPASYPSIPKWQCAGCCPLVSNVTDVSIFQNNKTFTFGFVVAHDLTLNATVLVFRGTVPSSLKNWIEDLHASRSTPYKGRKHIKVHKGFYDTWLSVRSQVFALIVAAQPSRLYTTGHSLGAALTQIAALDISESFPGIKQISVYNYGCPRLGNQALAKYYETRLPNTYRVVHWKDLVPHLPPHALGLWSHCGSEVWYDELFTSNRTFCIAPESPACSDSVVGDSVHDHRNYFNISDAQCAPSKKPLLQYTSKL